MLLFLPPGYTILRVHYEKYCQHHLLSQSECKYLHVLSDNAKHLLFHEIKNRYGILLKLHKLNFNITG